MRVFWYKPVKDKRWKNVKCNRRQRRNWIRTVLIRHESKPLPYSCFQFQCILPSRPSVNLCPMTTRGTCCFPNLSCLLPYSSLFFVDEYGERDHVHVWYFQALIQLNLSKERLAEFYRLKFPMSFFFRSRWRSKKGLKRTISFLSSFRNCIIDTNETD